MIKTYLMLSIFFCLLIQISQGIHKAQDNDLIECQWLTSNIESEEFFGIDIFGAGESQNLNMEIEEKQEMELFFEKSDQIEQKIHFFNENGQEIESEIEEILAPFTCQRYQNFNKAVVVKFNSAQQLKVFIKFEEIQIGKIGIKTVKRGNQEKELDSIKRNLQFTGCSYNCHQCDYFYNQFDYVSSIHPKNVPALDATYTDNKNQQGSVYSCAGHCRFGYNEGTGSHIPETLQRDKTYQFCIWIKTGGTTFSDFNFSISGVQTKSYRADDYGNMYDMRSNSFNMAGLLDDTWQRWCVVGTVNSDNQFLDLGNSYESFYYSHPILMEVPHDNYHPQVYHEETTPPNTCLACNSYTRNGRYCECSPGYREVTPGVSADCESPKPTMCDNFLRIEAQGASGVDESLATFVKVYINDVQVGTDGSNGINFYEINESTLTFVQQRHFTTAQQANMRTYVSGLSAGTLVAIGIKEDFGNLETATLTSLESLGMNGNLLHIRDGIAMIGKPGLAAGEAKQRKVCAINGANTNLVHCMKCNSLCKSCVYDYNEFSLIDGYYEFSANEQELQGSMEDFFGKTGTVYKINGWNRAGSHRLHSTMDTVLNKQTYQFSFYAKKDTGATINEFFFDIVDRVINRYIVDEYGNILSTLGNDHTVSLHTSLTDEWQRFLVVANHNQVGIYINYHFIDFHVDGVFYVSHLSLYQVKDSTIAPIRLHDGFEHLESGCEECVHHTRVLPDCSCASGYKEDSPAGNACVLNDVSSNCAKEVKIISQGNQKTSEILEMYLNNVSLGSFTGQGITIVALNADNTAKDSEVTCDNLNVSFDGSCIVNFINGIADQRVVLVGVMKDGSSNLSTQVYSAFQSIGMGSAEKIKFQAGFGMVGKKNSAQGSADVLQVEQRIGGTAFLVSCIEDCEVQCGSCLNNGDFCTSCADSNSSRVTSGNLCQCKPEFYEENVANCTDCEAPCATCDSQTNCITCIDNTRDQGTNCKCKTGIYSAVANQTCDQSCHVKCGFCEEITGNCIDCSDSNRNFADSCNCKPGFFQDGSLAACGTCDHSVCATCTGSNNNCDLDCDAGCTLCDNTGKCVGSTCKTGYVFNSSTGDCDKCNNKCQNCETDLVTCKDGCLDATREFSTNCACIDGKYSSVSDGTCDQNCDYKYGQCSEVSGNLVSCDNGNRDPLLDCACKPGFFEDGVSNKVCGVCDNTVCATCSGSDSNCSRDCDPGCTSCDNTGKCQGSTCKTGYVFNSSSGDCDKCSNKCQNCESDLVTCKDGCLDATREFSTNCACIDGTYASVSEGTCDLNCDFKYEKCEDVTGNKVSCANDKRDLSIDCNCKEGYFQNGASNKVCGVCDNSVCVTCLGSPTTCSQSCDAGCNSCDIDGKCTGNTCQTGYVFNTSSGDCDKCNDKCLNCESDLVTCIDGCTDPARDLSFNCACSGGKYSSTEGGTCSLDCDYKYAVCEDVSGNMVACSSQTRNPLDNCQCKLGFFENGVNNPLCSVCNRKCGSCRPSGDCEVSCDSSCARCGLDGLCISCNLGQYLNPTSQTCEDCSSKCEICDQNDKNNCLQCSKTEQNRSQNPEENCPCLEGFYEEESSQNCVDCREDCKSCENSSSCIECKNEDLIPPLCRERKEGKIAFIVDTVGGGSQEMFENCAVQCQTCSGSLNSCDSCKPGLNRKREGDCLCQDGYHDNDGTSDDCFLCPKSCKQCSGVDSCSECEDFEGVRLNRFSGMCDCEKGYSFDEENMKCEKCFEYLGQCMVYCPGNTEKDEDLGICKSIGSQEVQNMFSFYVCGLVLLAATLSSYAIGIGYQKIIKVNSLNSKEKQTSQ